MINEKDIPKRFKKTQKSFIKTLSNENPDKGLLRVFPKDITFHGQDKGEEIILVVRAHWVTWIPQLSLSFVLGIIPFLLLLVFDNLGISMTLGFILLGLILAITNALSGLFRWFYSVNIITNQRIIDVDFVNAFQHRFSEAQIEKIEDISHEHIGFLGSMFDVGTVYIQTAASQAEFEFENIPRPRDVQDTLNDVLEMKQKGEI
jgi:hypothetical protein